MPFLLQHPEFLQSDSLQADSISFSPLFVPEGDAVADSIPLLSADSAVGVPADPVPYTTRHDGVILGALFCLFVAGLLVYVHAGAFLARQAKSFFRSGQERVTVVPDLPSELRFGRLAWLTVVVECGLLAYFYYKEVSQVQTLWFSRYVTLGLLIVLFGVYFTLKQGLMRFVNWVFFDGKKIEQWNKSQLALAALESLLLLPAVATAPFVDIPLPEGLIFVLIAVIFVKILSFYKTYIIFFRRFGALLQIFLYFCALELIPLSVLYGFLVFVRRFLQINF